jgi:hypothetical protein
MAPCVNPYAACRVPASNLDLGLNPFPFTSLPGSAFPPEVRQNLFAKDIDELVLILLHGVDVSRICAGAEVRLRPSHVLS